MSFWEPSTILCDSIGTRSGCVSAEDVSAKEFNLGLSVIALCRRKTIAEAEEEIKKIIIKHLLQAVNAASNIFKLL